LVIEQNGTFIRIQCKTGKLNKNKSSITFRATSVYSHAKGKYVIKHYKDDVEFFGVYAPEIDSCYLIPVDKVGTNTGTLRLNEKYSVPNSCWHEHFMISKLGELGELVKPPFC
jgi:hypothetical protein